MNGIEGTNERPKVPSLSVIENVAGALQLKTDRLAEKQAGEGKDITPAADVLEATNDVEASGIRIDTEGIQEALRTIESPNVATVANDNEPEALAEAA